jgi:hypothetical protein
MADFTTPNLPGSNKFFNAAMDLFSKIKDTLKSKISSLASTFISTLLSDLLDFGDKLKTMIPELPDLPDVNLQAELTSLQSLSGSSRTTALASLKSKFESGLSAQGVELDDLVSKATDAFEAGKKISAVIPNFTIPAAGGDVVEKAKEVLQADSDDIKELTSDEINALMPADIAARAVVIQSSPPSEIKQKATREIVGEESAAGPLLLEPVGYYYDGVFLPGPLTRVGERALAAGGQLTQDGRLIRVHGVHGTQMSTSEWNDFIVKNWSKSYQTSEDPAKESRAARALETFYEIPVGAKRAIDTAAGIFDGDNNWTEDQLVGYLGPLGKIESNYTTRTAGGGRSERSFWQVQPRTATSLVNDSSALFGSKFNNAFSEYATGDNTALETMQTWSTSKWSKELLENDALGATMGAAVVVNRIPPPTA